MIPLRIIEDWFVKRVQWNFIDPEVMNVTDSCMKQGGDKNKQNQSLFCRLEFIVSLSWGRKSVYSSRSSLGRSGRSRRIRQRGFYSLDSHSGDLFRLSYHKWFCQASSSFSTPFSPPAPSLSWHGIIEKQ